MKLCGWQNIDHLLFAQRTFHELFGTAPTKVLMKTGREERIGRHFHTNDALFFAGPTKKRTLKTQSRVGCGCVEKERDGVP